MNNQMTQDEMGDDAPEVRQLLPAGTVIWPRSQIVAKPGDSMSVSPYPNPDRFDPVNQMHLSRAIQAAFGDQGIDGFEAEAGRIYSSEWKRPLVCALVEEALEGGWLGATQWQLSEMLTILKDRSWLSRGKHQGNISLDLFLRLLLHPGRPKNSSVTVESLRPWMHRSASIGIGRKIAKRLPTNWHFEPEFLSELNYELGCAVVDPASPWLSVQRRGSVEGALEMIRNICGPAGKDVIPSRYTDIRRRQTMSEISRLTFDGNVAFDRLEHISRHWRGVFLATSDLMESILGREGRIAA
jgi:hypothetical protein